MRLTRIGLTGCLFTLMAIGCVGGPSQDAPVGVTETGLLAPSVSNDKELSGTYAYGAEVIAYRALAAGSVKKRTSFNSPDVNGVYWDEDHQVAWQGDFDGDGFTDVFLQARYRAGQNYLYLSNKDFTFRKVAQWGNPDVNGVSWDKQTRGDELAVLDANGDGKDDILLGARSTGAAVLFTATGTGLVRAATYASPDVDGVAWNRFQIGDFDGDGKRDLVVQARATTDKNALYRSTPTGLAKVTAFGNPDFNAVDWSKQQLVIGDYDGDGKADVFAQSLWSTGQSAWLRSTGTGFAKVRSFGDAYAGASGWHANVENWTLSSAQWLNAGPGLHAMTGDFNGDGRTDFVQYASGIGWRVGISDGSKFNLSVWSTAPEGVDDFRTGDFDGDGRTDILNYMGSGVGWRVLRSTGTSFTASNWTTAGNYQPVLVGDFNGDGKDDFAQFVTNQGWRVNASTGTSFNATIWNTAGIGTGPWKVGDFDGDGRDDIAYFVTAEGWRVLRSTGSAFSVALWSGSGDGEAQYVGDFDGDGRSDLIQWVTTGYCGAGAGWRVLRSTGSSFSTTCWRNDTNKGSLQPDNYFVGDLNGDKKSDFIYYAGSGIGWHALTSTGSSFNAPAVWSGAGGWTNNMGGDFDGDGNFDFMQYTSTTVDNWRVLRSTSSDDARRIAAGDFNGDGKSDLLLVGNRIGPHFIMTSTGSDFVLGRQWNEPDTKGVRWIRTRPFVGQLDADKRDDIFLQSTVANPYNGFYLTAQDNQLANFQTWTNPDATKTTWDAINKNVLLGRFQGGGNTVVLLPKHPSDGPVTHYALDASTQISLTINGKPLSIAFDQAAGTMNVSAGGNALTSNEVYALTVFVADLEAAIPPAGSRYQHQDQLLHLASFFAEHDAISTIEDVNVQLADGAAPIDPEEDPAPTCPDGTESCLSEMWGSPPNTLWVLKNGCCNQYTTTKRTAAHSGTFHWPSYTAEWCGRKARALGHSCQGRCGSTCTPPEIHTQDCFNHDWCIRYHNYGWMNSTPIGPCGDEWQNAMDDFLFVRGGWVVSWAKC